MFEPVIPISSKRKPFWKSFQFGYAQEAMIILTVIVLCIGPGFTLAVIAEHFQNGRAVTPTANIKTRKVEVDAEVKPVSKPAIQTPRFFYIERDKKQTSKQKGNNDN